jgi:hypothetical protein
MMTDTVLVYRCEVIGDRLQGGHRYSNTYVKLTNEWINLPTPWQDGLRKHLINGSPFWCGCRSLKQFFKWWNQDHLTHHKKTRNRLAILEVPKSEVKYGKNQVVFNRKKARIVGKINEKGEAVFNRSYLRQTGQSA